ncbi:LPXTG cell wall anchor domain-containing protein [Faecalicatena contorta]|uniref:LPXTG cell wall anchor domain-containing protein n=1 Tax=Faecalicatena contorta TaxID=39482 RepID=UPI00321703FD
MKTTKKRFAAALFSICLLASMLPGTGMAVFAQDSVRDAWDGTADTGWYDGTKTEYEISTAEELAGLAVLVNSGTKFEGETVLLLSDLDLGGYEWVSIGTGNNSQGYFGGTFDGKNHCIYNVTSTESPDYSGLFGVISHGGTIQNLGVADAYFTNSPNFNMGILAAWANGGSIRNCYTTGNIKSAHGTDGFRIVGGLIGACTSGTQIIGCYSTATVESLALGDDDDTVGGLVGQWENATSDSLISDCWFDGKIVCEYTESAVGGILGANIDFYDYQPGVTINNCFVSTTDITCANPDNITWIASIVNGPVSNCYWPEDPDQQYAAVVRLIVDWDKGEASADENFDQSVCGEAAADWKSTELLNSLKGNAAAGVEWWMGISHPTFSWDSRHIPADYSLVNEAKANVPADLSVYTDETVQSLNDAINAAIEGKSVLEQDEVNAMAKAINDAIGALEYKGADYSKTDEAIAKANALNKNEYKDFSAVEAAVNAVVRDKNITEQAAVDGYAAAIENAINALEYKDADYSRVDAAIAKANALKKDQYKDFSAVEAAVNAVVRGKNITEQAVVDGYAADIEAAIKALEKKKDSPKQPADTASPAKPGKTHNSNVPQTGDNSSLTLWLVLMLTAAAALAGTAIYIRKKKANR